MHCTAMKTCLFYTKLRVLNLSWNLNGKKGRFNFFFGGEVQCGILHIKLRCYHLGQIYSKLIQGILLWKTKRWFKMKIKRLQSFASFWTHRARNWMEPKRDTPHELTIQKYIGFDQLQCVARENTCAKQWILYYGVWVRIL